jgi:two-component system sensor histidine kinase AlgZ
MIADIPEIQVANQDTVMTKKRTAAKDKLRITPDYTESVTGILLLAALLSSLIITAARVSNWDTTTVTDFSALLAASLLIALTDALVLKICNPLLGKLPLRMNLVTAYTLLMVTTFIICYALYFIVLEHWSLKLSAEWAPVSLLQIFIIASVNYLVVLAILLQKAKTSALGKSYQTANLQALQSRIRPHFMFNSMNSIAGLIRNNPDMAEQALQDLADLIRVLMADARKLVPLVAEIETSKQYLKIEKLRLGDRLAVQWHLKRIPKNCFVPSLILQPLLENAVYHGIEPSFGGGVIDIDMRADSNRVQILIRNPLPEDGERSHRKGNQIAMDNIKQRLIRHFGEGASLSSIRRNDMHITKIIFPVVTNQ